LENSNDNVKLDPVIAGIAAMIVVVTFMLVFFSGAKGGKQFPSFL
jgi:hypothetical protein